MTMVLRPMWISSGHRAAGAALLLLAVLAVALALPSSHAPGSVTSVRTAPSGSSLRAPTPPSICFLCAPAEHGEVSPTSALARPATAESPPRATAITADQLRSEPGSLRSPWTVAPLDRPPVSSSRQA